MAGGMRAGGAVRPTSRSPVCPTGTTGSGTALDPFGDDGGSLRATIAIGFAVPYDVKVRRVRVDLAGGQGLGRRDVDRRQTPVRGLRGINLLLGGFPGRAGTAGKAHRETNG